MSMTTKLIVGANSEIAKALALQLAHESMTRLVIVSRNVAFYQSEVFSDCDVISVDDYNEASIATVVGSLNERGLTSELSAVFMCHGLLHSDISFPEKKIGDFSPASFHEIIAANTVTPMLWLKHLADAFSNKQNCTCVVFSARVGSISDNRLGGWYSYRASKAALNMLLKTAAVELARRKKGIKLVSFHPGTTDTPLSKPFQKNVPEGKLFTPAFVANQVLSIVDKTSADGTLSYLDWREDRIDW